MGMGIVGNSDMDKGNLVRKGLIPQLSESHLPHHRKCSSMSKVTPPKRVPELAPARKSPYAASTLKLKRTPEILPPKPDLSRTVASYSLNASFGEAEDSTHSDAEKLEQKLAALQTSEDCDVPARRRDRFLKFMQVMEEIVEKNKPFSSLLRQIKTAIEHELDQSHLSSVNELEAQNKRLAQMVTEIKSRILRERQDRELREQRISALASENAALRDKAEELEKLLSSCPTSVMTQSKTKDPLGPFAEECKMKTRRIKELEEELAAYKRREEKLMQLLELTHKEGTRRQKGRPARSGDYSFGSPTLELSEGSESEAMTPMPSRRTERSQHAAS